MCLNNAWDLVRFELKDSLFITQEFLDAKSSSQTIFQKAGDAQFIPLWRGGRPIEGTAWRKIGISCVRPLQEGKAYALLLHLILVFRFFGNVRKITLNL